MNKEAAQESKPGCPSCGDNPDLLLVSLKNLPARQKLESFYETHSCCSRHPDRASYDLGQQIRVAGNEFGTVTGRPRRCGWFDAVATRYSARISGIDSIAVALLDVLSGLGDLQVCEAYEINGVVTRDLPSCPDDLRSAKPVLRQVEGWTEDITGVRDFDQLPPNAQQYICTIRDLVERPVQLVSVGPDRDQTIITAPLPGF